MASLSSPGVGSGLDINSLVSKLMDVERVPLTRLDKKEADFQAKLTAYGTLKGSLAAFQTAVRGLTTPAKFNTMKATAGDATVFSATTSSIAKPGNYSIEVGQLAQAHKLASPPGDEPGFADLATVIGSGTLRIEFGTWDGGDFTLNSKKTAKTLTIDSTNNTVSGIRDAINAANAGVSASIINDGSGYRLVLSSNETGAENALRITVDEGAGGDNADASGLSRLAYNTDAQNMQQTVAAQSAQLEIDGIAITRSSNMIGDAITGVTLNLLKTNADSPTQLVVTRETSGVKTAVEQFVSAYNDLAGTIKNLGGYDFKTQKGGILLGDSALRAVQSQLRNVMNQQLRHAGGGLGSLSEIGVSFQTDGTLALNGGKLDAVLADGTKDVASLFAVMGKPSDSLISYVGSSAATQPGVYGINVSQPATRGTATGSVVIGATTSIAGNANVLALKVDGVAATVTLTAGTDYSASALIAEMQTRINSDSRYTSLGIKVSVAQDEAGHLVLTSTRYGAASKVEITGGTAVDTLLGSVTRVDGKDVAGEIGGTAATGSGQTLTGAGSASGLQLLVAGGGVGARGTVAFSQGIAYQLDKTLEQLLSDDGAIANRSEGIDSSVKDLADQRMRLSRRLALIEERYKKQFNALDGLIASMQQTSTYLQQQLANLPSMSSKN